MITAPTHHLEDDLLLDYATGGAGEAVSLVVACHLTLCPSCRARITSVERVGGALLEAAPGVELAPDALDRLWSRIGDASSDSASDPARAPAAAMTIDGVVFPSPLRPYLVDARGGLRKLRFIAPGIRGVDLRLSSAPSNSNAAPSPIATASDRPGPKTRLVRLSPGLVIPQHAHGGDEYTLVFSGSFEDGGQRYARGDLRVRAAGEEHVQRIARGEACFALTVNEGALIPRGWHARVLSFLFDRP